jgi:hypothetical protein
VVTNIAKEDGGVIKWVMQIRRMFRLMLGEEEERAGEIESYTQGKNKARLTRIYELRDGDRGQFFVTDPRKYDPHPLT